MAFLVIAAVLLVVVVIFFSVAPQIGGKPSGNRLQRIQSSPRYTGGKFQNVIETKLDLSFRTMYKTLYDMLNGKENRVPLQPIQTIPFNRQLFNELGNGSVAAIAWFGHSSLLIKIHGKVFLTDPVLVGERASMLSFMGPKRFPYNHYIQLDELPHIDAVLLSHDHYDHLDYLTIKLLKDSITRFITPLGAGVHLEKWGVPAVNISEYDWWDELRLDENITFTCAPSRHFSGRALNGRNTTLWCSWIISGQHQRIYFGADSGYSPSFKVIGDKFGPFDLCLLECGAYSKYWPDIHMMPEETMQAALDLQAKQVMPIHWAKFNLSLHGWKEPIQRLKRQAAITGAQVVNPRIGQIIRVGIDLPQEEWWG